LARPQVILFLLTLFNFIWYFSGSSVVYHFGKKSITFCVVCPWYWDWSVTNPPSLLLLAASCTLLRNWSGYVIALAIGSTGFYEGVRQRVDAISNPNNLLPLWEAPDWQYLFALLLTATVFVLIMASTRQYLVNLSRKPDTI
jgi:hypothetical protein